MSLLSEERVRFHQSLVKKVLSTGVDGVPTNADRGNRASIAIAARIVESIGHGQESPRLAPQSSGQLFEELVAEFVQRTFPRLGVLRPGKWQVAQGGKTRTLLSQFVQYAHLVALDNAARGNPELATALGSDYFIKPDIVVSRFPESDEDINKGAQLVDRQSGAYSPIRESNTRSPSLHASISCKWTIRSDRAQNARSEGLNLIKNRKGYLPHVVVVTGEPLPSRIASLALGTGEIDCVYHFALPELVRACEGYPDSLELLKIMVGGNRLRDISDLPLDLCL